MGGGGGNKPWINGDAVATHAAAGLKHVHARVVVGQANQLARVDVEVIAHQREFIGKGNIHIAEAVLGELHQLGGAGGGGQ